MNSDRADILLREVVGAAERLRRLSDEETSARPAPDKWSKKEILGHLIDSAANNHHRFVRASGSRTLSFPSYDQDAWVSIQRYNDRPLEALVGLWAAYNIHIAHVIRSLPPESLETEYEQAPGRPMTVDQLVSHYISHVRHHLEQLRVRVSDQTHREP